MNLKITATNAGRSKSRQSFLYGVDRIYYTVAERNSSIQRVQIKVHPDCSVVVHAPKDAQDDAILAAVKKRGRWIYEQIRYFETQQAHVTPRRYISGESHYYLGKQYVLKVIPAKKDQVGVKLLRGKIEVYTSSSNADSVKALLENWYKERAREVFHRRLVAVLEQALWVKHPPALRVFSMQKQWGSCSPAGRITLNPYLVKASRECIDYVILHELCHIAEHNHGERFYRLMKQVMPNWEKLKTKLDGMASKLIEHRE